MITIFKYPIETKGVQTIKLPKDAYILCVQEQYGTPKIWALIDTSEPLIDITIKTFGTGQPISSDETYLLDFHKYIGTYQLMNGSLVFHVFEEMQTWS